MTITLAGTGIWSFAFRLRDETAACDAAVEAEELGYTAIWLGDGGGDDLFPRLDALLGATNHLTVATGVLNLWRHDASTVASRYASLADKYGERFLLGIGVGHAPQVKEYRTPLAKMNSFLDELDASGVVPQQSRVLAALGPKMLECARDRAAGAHPYLVMPEHTATAREALGARTFLAPELGVVVETNPELARAHARAGMELYFGLPNYVNNWRRYGFTDEDVAPHGSDRLIDALVAWGEEEAIAAHVQAHRDAGADHVCIQVLSADVASPDAPFPIEQWRRLAPALNGRPASGARPTAPSS